MLVCIGLNFIGYNILSSSSIIIFKFQCLHTQAATLLTAYTNLRAALVAKGIKHSVKMTVPFQTGVLSNMYAAFVMYQLTCYPCLHSVSDSLGPDIRLWCSKRHTRCVEKGGRDLLHSYSCIPFALPGTPLRWRRSLTP